MPLRKYDKVRMPAVMFGIALECPGKVQVGVQKCSRRGTVTLYMYFTLLSCQR